MAGSSRIALDNGQDERPPQSTPETVERPIQEPPATPAPQPETPPASTAEPPAKELDPEVKERVDMLTRRYYEAKRLADENAGRAQSLERQLQQRPQYNPQVPPPYGPPGSNPPGQDAEERAYQRVKAEQTQAQFNDACNNLYARGREAYGEGMDEAVKSLNAVGWGNRPDALAALTQIPEGHKVYRELASDLDNAARVLAMPPMQMAVELARMSLNGSTPSNSDAGVIPPRTPSISRAPEPLRPVGGRSAPAPRQLQDMNIADFIRTRDQAETGSRRIRR